MISRAPTFVRLLMVLSIMLPSGCTYPVRREVPPRAIDTQTTPKVVGLTKSDGTEVEFETPADSTDIVAFVATDTLFAEVDGARRAFPLSSVEKLWLEEMYHDRWASWVLGVAAVGGVALIVLTVVTLNNLSDFD